MSKKDGQKATGTRKNTKGVPRVTDKVIAMDEAGRKAWLDEKCKTLTAEVRAEVEKRLAEALKGGREPKKINFATAFKGRTVKELMEAQTALTSALAEASESEEKELEKKIAELQQQKVALEAAKAAKAAIPTQG